MPCRDWKPLERSSDYQPSENQHVCLKTQGSKYRDLTRIPFMYCMNCSNIRSIFMSDKCPELHISCVSRRTQRQSIYEAASRILRGATVLTAPDQPQLRSIAARSTRLTHCSTTASANVSSGGPRHVRITAPLQGSFDVGVSKPFRRSKSALVIEVQMMK